MKKNHTVLSPEESLADLAHFVWCALMGLRLVQRDGQAMSPLTIHAFLVRWLAYAQKQRRFPRFAAADIDSLLRLGRLKGPTAGLQQHLHQSCTELVTQQSDLLWLTHAIEYLRAQGWVYAVVTDDEWIPGALYAEYAGGSALLVRKSELQKNFTDKGQQSDAVAFVVVGDVVTVGDVLHVRELCYAISEQHAGWCLLSLLPAAGVGVSEKLTATS